MPAPALLRRWVALLLLVLLAAPAAAQTYPKQTGWVTDEANLLSPADEQALTAQLYQLKQQTGRQLAVATVNSLGGQDIDTYAPLLFREWKLGSSAADDGVLLLVAPSERRVRITTGYGAGGFLTDLVAGRIIREQITPSFKAGDYPGGIKAGVTAIAQFMQLSPAEQQQRASQLSQEQQQQRASPGAASLAPLAIWGMVILFVLLTFTRRLGGQRYRGRSGGGISPWVVLWGLDALSRGSRGGSGWGGGGGWGDGGGFGGGGGGGFGGWGGGGGSSGGGGASGSW